MNTLWDIDQAILACIDAETGEVIDTEQLDALNMEREAKIEGVALWVKSLDAEAAAIREEEKALADRRRAKERKAERLREYLATALDGQPFETARVRMSFRSSTGLKVTDAETLLVWLETNHDDCLSYKAPALLLDKVKRLIRCGIAVPGCELETRNNLQLK